MRSSWLFLPALVASLCACTPTPTLPGDAGDPGAGDAGVDAGPLAASAYCETIEPFFCDYYLRCGRMAGVDTPEACREVFLEQCNGRYEPRYVGLADAELLRLSRAGVDACRAHLEDVACGEQIRDLDGPCAELWTGLVPAGGACGFDVETFVCAPGTACVLTLDFCGTCERVVDDGAPCGAATEEDVTCARDSTCEDGACVPRVGVGGACGPEDTCVLGARCEGGRCTAPTIVGVGDSCDPLNRCPYKSHCEAGACVEDNLIGETCTAPVGCASGWCASDDTCQALFPAGTSCSLAEQCATGICDPGSGTCASVPGRCFAP